MRVGRPPLATVALALLLAAGSGTFAAQAQGLLFWSTQAKPEEETRALREQVLSGFEQFVDYQPRDSEPFLTRIQAELEAGKGTIGVLGGLHSDFTTIADDLVDLSGMVPDGLEINETFLQLGTLGTSEQKYLPWMQASFIMAAHRQALQHLPEGADLDALTYDQLVEWGKRMEEATGAPKIGLPMGPTGLKHRFLQGYLYPSFTGSVVREFRSPEAQALWETFKELWSVTNPASVGYDAMQGPLLAGDVWVAWDHTARLAEAFRQKPDDFIAFPAPAGPAGRGYMPVVAVVAIPRTAPDIDTSKELVAYLLKPETQIATLRAVNFFPVVDVDLPSDMPASVTAASMAIASQAGAPDAIPALALTGLGELGARFNQVYADAIQRILLNGEDVRQVLDTEAQVLRIVLGETGAPCSPPDAPSEGFCPVE